MPHLAQLLARSKDGSARATINLADSLNVLASVALHAGRADQAAWQFRSARELLDEVLKEGDAAQKQQAQTMLTALG